MNLEKLKKVTIIAEAGVNHNGQLDLAFALIEEAKEVGADFVKFQTFQTENIVVKSQKGTYAMLKDLELSYDNHEKLYEHCQKIGIPYLSTPFGIEDVRFIDRLKLPYWKIPSGEITNLPYLRELSRYKRPVLLSTGMANLGEIEAALAVLTMGKIEREDIILLHCNSAYPSPFADANLKAIQTLRNAFGFRVGYSDHTPGVEAPIAAVTMGACVIEKHFTLDRNMAGPDHKASIDPKQFTQMVSAIRNIEQALGDGFKRPSQSEAHTIQLARKSIVSASQIRKGEKFTAQNLTTKRPGTGISPMCWEEIIGSLSTRDYQPDELINRRD